MTDSDDPTRNSGDGGPRLFYGWTVVGAVFVILVVTSGLGFYNASVILSAAADELDVSVGAVSGATALFFATSGVTGFALARQMEIRDIRIFYLAGGLLGAAALLSLRFVDTVLELYAFFAVFGMGFALAGLVPGTTLVTRWFEQRRSVALSVASTGLSLGGIVLTPVAAWLIDSRTLAGAGTSLAAMWIVGVIPIGLLLIRSRPADKGLRPDGAPAVAATASSAEAPTPATAPLPASPATPASGPSPTAMTSTAGMAPPARGPLSPNANGDAATAPQAGASFADARRTRFFLMMCVAYALIFFAQVGTLAHLYNVASERVDKTTAGTALSLLALTSVIGRLIGGLVVLRVPTMVLSAALTLLQGLALIGMANSFATGTILASAILLGMSVGNLLMLQPLLLAEAFGVAEYSRIYSFNQLIGTIGVAGGPFALGLLHDVSNYRTALTIAGLASVAGFVSFLAAGGTERARGIWQPDPAPAVVHRAG